jgi:hypothetical protein
MDIPPPINILVEMIDFCETDQDTDRHSVTVPARICTSHHMTEKHPRFNPQSHINVHVGNKVVNHILKRHGPHKSIREYNLGLQDYDTNCEMVPTNYATEQVVDINCQMVPTYYAIEQVGESYDSEVYEKTRRVWNRPTVFLQGWNNVVRMTLINPDIIEPGSEKHNQTHTLYCKEFVYPIGMDNRGNLLHICKVVVNSKRRRNTLVTAYPLRQQSLDKCQTECTLLCDVFMEFEEKIK